MTKSGSQAQWDLNILALSAQSMCGTEDGFSALRGYIAGRVLVQNGYACSHLAGGYRLYASVAEDVAVGPPKGPRAGNHSPNPDQNNLWGRVQVASDHHTTVMLGDIWGEWPLTGVRGRLGLNRQAYLSVERDSLRTNSGVPISPSISSAPSGISHPISTLWI